MTIPWENTKKFRVWDKRTHKMWCVWEMGWYYDNFSKTYGVWQCGVTDDHAHDPEEDEYIWLENAIIDPPLVFMQYTGFKDKNGTEIYEGDIIRYKGRYIHAFYKYGTLLFEVIRGIPFKKEISFQMATQGIVVGHVWEKHSLERNKKEQV